MRYRRRARLGSGGEEVIYLAEIRQRLGPSSSTTKASDPAAKAEAHGLAGGVCVSGGGGGERRREGVN